MSIAAIILAAGESTRMGRLKQLLPWGGTTLIDWQVRQMFEAGADDVVVVLGHEAAAVRRAVREPARIVINEAYREGRASSLRCGASAIAGDVEAILVLSVDQPRPSWVTRRLIQAWRDRPSLAVIPEFGGHKSHPVLVDASLLGELREASEEHLGLRGVLDRHATGSRTVALKNDSVDVDLNTVAEYESAVAAFDRGEWGDLA